jgi:hypothetical protein
MIRQEHGFELDAFFEPHVLAWLKDTESSQTQEWVSRAVGMDSVRDLGEGRGCADAQVGTRRRQSTLAIRH